MPGHRVPPSLVPPRAIAGIDDGELEGRAGMILFAHGYAETDPKTDDLLPGCLLVRAGEIGRPGAFLRAMGKPRGLEVNAREANAFICVRSSGRAD